MHTPKQKSNDGLGPLHNVFLLAISVQLSRFFFYYLRCKSSRLFFCLPAAFAGLLRLSLFCYTQSKFLNSKNKPKHSASLINSVIGKQSRVFPETTILYPQTRVSSLQDSSVWLKKIECRTHSCSKHIVLSVANL